MMDPVEFTKVIEKQVIIKNNETIKRKYYRFRGGRWYGGIATADTVGCNLSCGFCWSWRANTSVNTYGEYFSSSEVAKKLIEIARSRNYRLIRVSGGEPTVGFNHLLQLLDILSSFEYTFILETNGILIGYDKNYAKELSKYEFLHVRVSIKGTNEEEFSKLTNADPLAFRLQLAALKNLLDENVDCHAAAMLSFSDEEGKTKLIEELRKIDEKVASLEEEYVFLYPHVVEILKKRDLTPRIAYSPDGIPSNLI